MGQVPTKTLTLEAFLEQLETKPASEYIDGAIIQKPMPQGKHSTLQRESCFVLTTTFRTARTAQAFPELRCNFGERSLVPDIAVFRTERISRDSDGAIANQFNLPPDWMIEIFSPNQSQSNVIRKILHCLNEGTDQGWLLDPDEPCIFVYGTDRSVQVFDEGTEKVLSVPDFAPAVRLTVGEIFGWLKI